MTTETMIHKGAWALAFVAVALAVAACGVKSSPAMPEGSAYPRNYPAPSAAGKALPETGDKKTSRHPQGFPYEYPNRPPAR